MIIEVLLRKWEDTKDTILKKHKTHNIDIGIAMASFGLNKELHNYDVNCKYKLVALENKWDKKFGYFLDTIDLYDKTYIDKSRLLKVVDNFGKVFYNDLIKEFPKHNFIRI